MAESSSPICAYDNRGNLTGETRPGSIGVTTTCDAHGQLVGYARTGEPTQTNLYNGLGDRVQVTQTAATADVRRYVYDAGGRLLGDYGASAADVKGKYVWLLPEAANDNEAAG